MVLTAAKAWKPTSLKCEQLVASKILGHGRMEGGIYIYRAILTREGRQNVRGREGERGGGWRRREEMDNERE